MMLRIEMKKGDDDSLVKVRGEIGGSVVQGRRGVIWGQEWKRGVDMARGRSSE